MIGQRYNKWTVVVLAESDKRYEKRWMCQCDCGTKKAVREDHLVSGASKSCGCFRSEAARATHTTHGMRDSGTYTSWLGMRARCERPSSNRYYIYGARGIKVCDRWQSFENFLADMGECPPGMSIDRKENDGDYEPGNCRWATRVMQANNTRANVMLSHGGKTQSVSLWARELGLNPKALYSRIRRGDSVERILR